MASADPPFRRLGIVGLGLIGGSIALGLRRAAPDVRILGVDAPEVIARARARAIIDEPRPSVADLDDADLVVIAAPVDAAIDLIGRIAPDFPALVTDTCSTKRHVMAAAAGLTRFVGGHPMAGAELGGLDHADAALFDRRAWYLTTAHADSPDVAIVSALIRTLGGVPALVEAGDHDRTMAYVSHVPQLLAVALMRAAGEACGGAGLAASGRAFRDMTRLASSPADIWTGILATNADNVDDALRRLAGTLPDRAGLLDGPRLAASFAEARDWRSCLPDVSS